MVLLLTGCGSSSAGTNAALGANQAEASATSTTTSTASTSTAPPSFVVKATTQAGDRVRLDGRFGPAQTAQESDVEASALSGCPEPANNGRAMIVRLDLTATLESSLSGRVGFATGDVSGGSTTQQLMAFVMGDSSGATCLRGEPSTTTGELGTMQPRETRTFTLWLVLPEAITPSDPHPSERTLGSKRWLMLVPQPTVNGSGYAQDQQSKVSGPRVVQCSSDGSRAQYIAVVGDTPTTMKGESSVMGEGPCPGA